MGAVALGASQSLEQTVTRSHPDADSGEHEPARGHGLALETVSMNHSDQDGWGVNSLGTGDAVRLAELSRVAAREQLKRKDLRNTADRHLRQRLRTALTAASVTLNLN